MKLRSTFLTLLLLVSLTILANDYDQQKPFGFCTVTSRTANTAYNITGGGCYVYPVEGVSNDKVAVLTSTGNDMKTAIQNAISSKDVIIFDGSNGDFFVSSFITLNSVKNKTLLGINGARLCTTWYITDEIRKALDDAGVPNMSTSSGTGGQLPNGVNVSEEAEYNTRRIIIEMTGDNSETYRNSGVFYFKNCENIIVRNISFLGPGSIDVGGADLLSFVGTKNCWVDHCDFVDGMDGNFDITQKSDFNTVSWCTFSYTDQSYMHQNTNLVGSSDSEATGYLNTTFAFNMWGAKCRARMPMARVGKIHMLNNYFNCAGNGSACINPRKNSEFLVEGNYFASGVSKCYTQSSATAVTWTSTNHSSQSVSSFGDKVTVPYAYTEAPVNDIPTVVGENAGATLTFQEVDGISQPTTNSFRSTTIYNLAGQKVGADYKGIVIVNGRKVVRQ